MATDSQDPRDFWQEMGKEFQKEDQARAFQKIIGNEPAQCPPPDPVYRNAARQLSKPMPSPRDYDDFKREIGSCSPHEVKIMPTKPGSDFYRVHHKPSGWSYRFSSDQARNEGFGSVPLTPPSEWVEALTPAPSAHVHILHQGSPLCGFSHSRPVDWPRGHEWISVDAFRQGAKISCSGCFERSRKL